MEYSDNLLARIDSEIDFKAPINALIGYNKLETGKKLSELAAYFVLSRSEKSSITYLQLLDSDIEDSELKESIHYNKFFTELGDDKEERNEITVRSFEKISDNYVSDILKASKDYKSNLILFGIENDQLTLDQCQKYTKLHQDPMLSDIQIFEQFSASEAKMLDCISSLFELSIEATGVFINNGLDRVKKIFVPILSHSDMLILPFVYLRFAQKENISIMIWDAIGAIQTTSKFQKLYQTITKKSEDKVYFWDSNKKIDIDFIQKLDLFIIGYEGWRKLIATNLPWLKSLPSTMIFKGKTI